MKLLLPLLGHLLVTLARLACSGGIRAVVAESLAVKHQLLIMKRSQRRAALPRDVRNRPQWRWARVRFPTTTTWRGTCAICSGCGSGGSSHMQKNNLAAMWKLPS